MQTEDIKDDPLEVSLEPEDKELEVEVVDDTPEADRGRKPLERDPDVSDEELQQYSVSVQKRINDLKRAWHDERRTKEQKEREQAEALRLAQAVLQENEQLKSTLAWGQQQYITQYQNQIEAEEALAKDKYRRAYEAADTDGLLEAQSALNNITLKKAQMSELQRPIVQQPSLQTQNNPVYNAQYSAPVQTPPRDYKAEDWAARNSWFGSDEEMTSLAYGLHQKLVNQGFDPASDEYYQEIDKGIRLRFPEKFKSSKSRGSSPVAPVSRTTSARKVTLTASAMAIAKRLGITPEQYAKHMLKLQENQNG